MSDHKIFIIPFTLPCLKVLSKCGTGVRRQELEVRRVGNKTYS
jgi:hypothetical protein